MATTKAARKPISASLRWNVFYRDGFACRYCGAQAGEDGVELVIDHVLSVADGGDNRHDNLVTSCRGCNAGKGAKSLQDVPTSEQVIARVEERRGRLCDLRDGIQQALEAQREIEQQIVNIKCDAYGVKRVEMGRGEAKIAARLIEEFGADAVVGWYNSAASRNVKKWATIKYVCGCARNERERAAQ